MLHRVMVMAGALLLSAGMLLADVTGKYSVELERPAGMEGRGGGRMGAMQTTLDLKEAAGKLTGTVHIGAGERARSMEISNGKIDGAKFSFENVLETPMGTMTMIWEGSVEGGELKGTRTVKDSERPAQKFTAKKSE